MLALITSLRSRALAQDWNYHVWLLERTLDSMLAQTNADFQVVVVCHEIPTVRQRNHPKVTFLPVIFPPPRQDNDEMCADKVLKLSAGIEWAIAFGCDYVMLTDADDLVNRNTCAWVSKNRGAAGWYSASELFYAYGGRWMRKYALPGMLSGPCAVFRSDILQFDEPPFDDGWAKMLSAAGESRYLGVLIRMERRVNIVTAMGHTRYRSVLEANGNDIKPLPFPGNVVINHYDSTSHVAGGSGSRIVDGIPLRPNWRTAISAIKQRAQLLPSLRPLTSALRRDFSVLHPRDVPAAYRSRGSIF